MTQDQLIPNPAHRIICFKMGKVKRENLYEMTRKYWKVNLIKASKATHALAVVNGIVEAVYLPYKWYPTQYTKYLGRYEFDGEEDALSEYLGISVNHFYKCIYC